MSDSDYERRDDPIGDAYRRYMRALAEGADKETLLRLLEEWSDDCANAPSDSGWIRDSWDDIDI